MKEFLIQFTAGFAANVLTAVLLYVLIDRWLKRKERDEENRERKRAEAMRALDSENIQRATLLQQFPPLMQRLVDVQRDSFAAALFSCDEPETTRSLQTIASNLRHFANVHLDTVSTLASLGANVGGMSLHAEFTNLLAIVSIHLIRNDDVQELGAQVEFGLELMEQTYPPSWRASSHLERMQILLANIVPEIEGFAGSTPLQRHVLFCALTEAVGHNTNLLLDRVNTAFDRELSTVRGESVASELEDPPFDGFEE